MNIDGYGAASTPYDPAHCELTIWWTDKSTAPQSLLRDIKMKGVSKRSFEIMLSVSDLEGIYYGYCTYSILTYFSAFADSRL